MSFISNALLVLARHRLEFPTLWLPRQTVPVKFALIKSFRFKEWCARRTRTPDLLVRSHMTTLTKTCRSGRKPEEFQRVMTILAQLPAPSFITDNQQLVTILHY